MSEEARTSHPTSGPPSYKIKSKWKSEVTYIEFRMENLNQGGIFLITKSYFDLLAC